MHIRALTGFVGTTATLAFAATVLAATSADAEPPAVEAFDVAFVDGSCGEGLDAHTTLHVQFTDKLLPDGSVHHWVDLRGVLVNQANDRYVTVLSSRRFTDAADGSSAFSGLQSTFNAPGAGVLFHTSGRSDEIATRGHWDAAPDNALPAPVCDYLFPSD